MRDQTFGSSVVLISIFIIALALLAAIFYKLTLKYFVSKHPINAILSLVLFLSSIGILIYLSAALYSFLI